MPLAASLPPGGPVGLVVPHTGIDYPVADVRQGVDDDIAARDHQHRRLEDGIVPAQNGLDGVLADSRDSKDLLDDQGAAEQLARLGPDQGEYGDESVLESMSGKYAALGHPFRPSRSDVVVGEYFEHGRAGHPH